MAEPLLKRGSSGTAVRQLQQALKEAGHHPGPIDGEFGPATEAAVRAFQQGKGIAVDGIVGDITWLNIDEDAVFSHPVVRRGSTGLAVRRVQKRLTLAGYQTGGVDGIFGPATEAGVKALQRNRALVEDGIVGPKTWDAIDALGD
jgi:peptidoglycan hydrolase-like protein with peptidoglycan-binding domain